MRRQTGIVHSFNLRFGLLAEEFRDAMGIFSMSAHAVRKSLKAAQGQPAFERRRHSAALALDADVFSQPGAVLFPYVLSPAVLPKDQRAHGHVTVAGKIFCDRVHHYVDAKMQRLLEERGGPGIV